MYSNADESESVSLYITGPAGISVDTKDLFTRADFVLIFATVGIILLLLIVTYKSPFLAIIPLLAAEPNAWTVRQRWIRVSESIDVDYNVFTLRSRDRLLIIYLFSI